MDPKDLTPEQRERALQCETPEEMIALANEMGVELTDEQLETVAGGSWSNCTEDECPNDSPW